jgi:uncharacterized HhH-GPD family protein
MFLASTAAANELLERDPLALLIGMLLDQQIPMEKAFTSPDVLRERLGDGKPGDSDGLLDAKTIADYDPEALVELFRQPPALHRFPGSMAARVQALARMIVEQFDGDAAAVWADARSGTELVRRVAALPGFGAQKAKIFVALLGKQYGVRPAGWEQAAGEYGEANVRRSVADIVDADSLAAVRSYKQQAKAARQAK